MNLRTLGRLSVMAFALLWFGCAPTRVQLRPDFWKESQHTVGVAVMKLPQLHVYPLPEEAAASMGILQYEIYKSIREGKTGALESHLQIVDVSRFGEVADRYVQALQERGFTARKLAQPPDLERLPPFKATESGVFASKDLRALAAQEGIDKLILLSLQKCGTRLLPFWEMEVMCVAGGELIDLSTNRVEWRDKMEDDAGVVAIKGDWEQAPDYPGVTASLGKAVTQAQDHIVKDFFRSGSSSCTDTDEYRKASAVEKKRLLEACKQARTAASTP